MKSASNRRGEPPVRRAADRHAELAHTGAMISRLALARTAVSALALAAAGATLAQPVAPRAELSAPEPAAAVCERAARQTLAGQASTEVVFNGPPLTEISLSNESQSVMRGTGRSRGASGVRPFNYLCTVDLATREAVGMVLRDQAPLSARPAPGRPPAEPDLSALSPAACESSAVEALRRQWPQVSKISFDRSTRRFRQPNAEMAELHGSGIALPAPGAPNTVFTFDCAVDPRDGWVIRTSVSG